MTNEGGIKKTDWNFVVFQQLMPGASYEQYQQRLFGEPGEKERLYLTIGLDERGRFTHKLEKKRPVLGGYWSEKKYGRADYCPAATRVHKKNIMEHGVSPNLIYFESIEAAILCGFTPCGSCWLKGEGGLAHWHEYLTACEKLGVEPSPR